MRILKLIPVLLLLACSKGAAASAGVALGQSPADSSTALRRAPRVLHQEHLAHLLLVAPDIYCGAQPHGPLAFAALRELGVKTVVCVDGDRPDVEAAAHEGLAYVHIPIGYDGIRESAGDAFYRLMKEAQRPIYFHCHHGKHRGPAAAAIGLRAATGCDETAALAVLSAAGTSHDYPGLWRDVTHWTPPPPGKALPALLAIAPVDPFPSGMAQVDRTWDRIKAWQKLGWNSAELSAQVPLTEESRLLLQQLEDCAGCLASEQEQEQDPALLRAMEKAVGLARTLHSAAEDKDAELLEKSYLDLRATCGDCHHDFRNDLHHE